MSGRVGAAGRTESGGHPATYQAKGWRQRVLSFR